MIFFIIHFMTQFFGLKIPAVFTYYSTRMMLAAITSLLLSISLGPCFIRKLYELKAGQPIRSEADACALLATLHQKKQNTPTMGGVLILTSMLISLFLWMDLTHIFTLILLLTTLVFGGLGAYDDYLKLKYKNPKGLSGRKKLLIQFAFGGVIALYLLVPAVNQAVHVGRWFAPPIIKEHIAAKQPVANDQAIDAVSHTSLVPTSVPLQEYASRLYLPFLKDPLITLTGLFTIGALFLILFVITGASNAVNLTDGLDGLAAGCLIMVAFCLAIIAFMSNNIDIARYLHILYIEGSGEIAIYLSAFAGACLGFLWYNGYPAQVIMGDTGSLALGGIIGVSAVLLKREFLLGLIGGIFVVETLSVILQVSSYRWRNKKRIFLCTPLHHHFEYKGWPETKIVLRFWIVGLLLAILGLASLKFQ
jgi:phospho-N-acetylmuramoyl-pentapeptide-transferase